MMRMMSYFYCFVDKSGASIIIMETSIIDDNIISRVQQYLTLFL